MAAKKKKAKKTTDAEPAKGKAGTAGQAKGGDSIRRVQLVDSQASIRAVTDWTSAKLKQAEQQANSGNLQQAAQVCEWLLGDDRFADGVDSVIQQLLGERVSFEFVGKRNERIAKTLEGEGDFWVSYPEGEQMEFLRWGMVLGVAPGKHEWTEYRQRLMPDPQFWHPSALRYSYDEPRAWYLKNAEGQEEILVPGNGKDILHTPFGRNRPWLRGLWRSCGRWLLLKYYAMSDWARHGENAARLVLTTEDEDVQDEQRRQLAQEIFASAKDSVIALAFGLDLKLVEARADTKSLYDAQINAANAAFTIRIKGGNLSTLIDGNGSRAAAEVQERTGDQAKVKFHGQAWSTTLHDQSLNWYCQFNHGNADDTPYPKWGGDKYKESAARATTMVQVGEAVDKLRMGLVGSGKQLDVVQVYSDFGIPMIEGEAAPRPMIDGEGEDIGEPGAPPQLPGGKPKKKAAEPKPKKEDDDAD